MRYLIKFKYDGTNFHGFQRQKSVKNVQGELEKVLSKILMETIVIKGAGRTDAGVHALCQCAHFDTNLLLDDELIEKINTQLKGDIIINEYHIVPSDFHARHLVKEKTYYYLINNGEYDSEKKGYYYQIKYNLDMMKMKEACELFIGTHDFRNFVSGTRNNYISTIFKIDLQKKNNTIKIEFTGIGFYRYMVRHLVGAIIDVGKSRISIEELKSILDNPNLNKQLNVAPAEGLYLANIKY